MSILIPLASIVFKGLLIFGCLYILFMLFMWVLHGILAVLKPVILFVAILGAMFGGIYYMSNFVAH